MTNQSTRFKILFILPSLRAGGAERVISFIATNLNKQNFESILVVIGNAKESAYSTQRIEVHYLNKSRVLKAIPQLFKYIFLANPKIVVGSISHVNRVIAMFSIFFPKTKFIGREASVLSIMKKYPTVKRNNFNPFFRKYHKYLDAIVCQSLDMAEDLKINYSVPEKKIAIINNPISENFPLKKKSSHRNKIKQLITIGRLSKEKGHERLLKVIAKLNIPYHYTIIGNGNEKESLLELAKTLNIFHKITHIPQTDNVVKYLTQSDIFLQGSYVEGFPNALLESCAVGTPVIAFIAPGGTKEIILENINGFIVQNESECLQKINMMINTNIFTPKLVSETVTSRYSKNIILSKYETLFENLLTKGK